MSDAENHPIYGPFFGVMGAASAIIFSGKHSSLFVCTLIPFYFYSINMSMIWSWRACWCLSPTFRLFDLCRRSPNASVVRMAAFLSIYFADYCCRCRACRFPRKKCRWDELEKRMSKPATPSCRRRRRRSKNGQDPAAAVGRLSVFSLPT